MRSLFLSVFICLAIAVCAQRDCVSGAYLESSKALSPVLDRKLVEIENFIQRQTPLSFAQNLRTEGPVLKIPVVVHVVYNTPSQNISDLQIQSQIDALNRDFRHRNADSVHTPQRFRSAAADVRIEFYLAKSDPNGRPTTGITRKNTNVAGWSSDDKIKSASLGGEDAWDSKSYLNIWVGNLRTGLGYATVPGSDASKDGLVISYTAFGTINSAAPFDLGRTAVHEAGHWLGLKHIWGDTYCGDDKVDDTPPQSAYTSGCPSTFRSSCSNGSIGDMYMNFMDFTNDACINLFTEGQKTRMRSLFQTGGPRASLLQSKALDKPWNFTVAAEPDITNARLYPNPASETITLNFNSVPSFIGKKVQLLNAHGIVIEEIQVSRSQKVSIGHLKPGLYFIKAENGGERFMEKLVKL